MQGRISGEVTSDLDIYRAAKLVMDKHGQDSAFHAAQRADALLDAGDLDGAAAWRRILSAVRQMQDRTAGGTMH